MLSRFRLCPEAAVQEESTSTSCIVELADGLVWLNHPGACPRQSWAEDIAPDVAHAALGSASSVAFSAGSNVDGVSKMLLSEAGTYLDGSITLIKPEESVEMNYCQWDGDGHFNLTSYPGRSPPTLGQIVMYLRKVDAAKGKTSSVVHVTSEGRLATGAVLAGAVMVLAQGMSAGAAWAKLLQGCPAPSPNPAQAWDHFAAPFSPHGTTGETSLTVLDCLSGLEAAKRLGWLEDYKTFDVEAWTFLRRKFDASWLIPGEMMAFGDPQLTAQNPRFPGLLGSPKGRCDSDISNASTASSFSYTDENEDYTSSIKMDGGGPAAMPQMEYLKRDNFASLFLRSNIGHIVRLNFLSECQQEINCPQCLTDIRMKVSNYEFRDGGVPCKKLLRSFISHCEKSAGDGLAVHCKAGLGRTGTMVGAYAVEKYGIDGKAWHGWVRLARPGSVQTVEQEKFLRDFGAKTPKALLGCLRLSI